MENELLYLVVALSFILSLLTVILCYLIIRKYLENRMNRLIEQEINHYREPVLNYLLNGGDLELINPKKSIEKKAMEELLNKFVEILEGETEKSYLFKLADLHLRSYYQVRLRSKKWSIRINTLYQIEDFQIRSLEDEVRELIKCPKVSKEEKVLGLRILSLFKFGILFDELTKNHSQLSEHEYRIILFQANNETMDQFIINFHLCQLPLKNALIDVIGMKKELKYYPIIESIFQKNHGELRLRALKALSSIGFVNEIEPYLKLCHSQIWQERMMLAKLLGKVLDMKGISCLVNLLHDSSWWVRYQAGQSLKNFPHGKQILQNVINSTADPFAKDMAWEWVNKGD